jgi:hypothetical protein
MAVVESEARPRGSLVQVDLEGLDLGQMDLGLHLVVDGKHRWKEMPKAKREPHQMRLLQDH